jgi:hypothetical protein
VADWSHLVPLVDALEAAGNSSAGFHPNQGGTDCHMARPLDFAIVDSFVGTDPHDIAVDRENQEVACRHCWASIHGGDA